MPVNEDQKDIRGNLIIPQPLLFFQRHALHDFFCDVGLDVRVSTYTKKATLEIRVALLLQNPNRSSSGAPRFTR